MRRVVSSNSSVPSALELLAAAKHQSDTSCTESKHETIQRSSRRCVGSYATVVDIEIGVPLSRMAVSLTVPHPQL